MTNRMQQTEYVCTAVGTPSRHYFDVTVTAPVSGATVSVTWSALVKGDDIDGVTLRLDTADDPVSVVGQLVDDDGQPLDSYQTVYCLASEFWRGPDIALLKKQIDDCEHWRAN